MFKLTQQHTCNWEVSKLLIPMTIFYPVDVHPLKYRQIYNIFFNHKRYDVTIGNYPCCSYIYFVIMSTTSLGGCGAWLQYKHLYEWKHIMGGPKIVVKLYYFWRVLGLSFNHVIIMKHFHKGFAYYGRSKPKEVECQKYICRIILKKCKYNHEMIELIFNIQESCSIY